MVVNNWTLALKDFNKGKIWSIPPKGSLEYEKVKKLQLKYNVKGGEGLKDGFGSVIDTVNKGLDSMLPQSKDSISLFPCEKHAKKIKNGEIINYTYLGPGTKVLERLARGDKPIDKLDEYARDHDKTYTLLFKKKLEKGIKVTKAEVQNADKTFVDGVNRNKSENPMLAKVIPPLFKAKKIAEDIGVLSHTAFFDLKTGNGFIKKLNKK